MLKISIITATYNSGSTIEDTIKSVLAQDYNNFEHIIIDGASKDNTLSIIESYRDRYKGKLQLCSEPDHGIYDAMNKGIAMATGDVIGILNSDDFYTSNNILSAVNDTLSQHAETDAVYGDIHFVKDDDLTKCTRYYSSRGFKRWKMRCGFQPAHPSFYCRKKCYDSFGAFDIRFKVSADFDCMLRFIYINKISTLYLNKDFVTMRQGGASTNGLSSYIKSLKNHYSIYKKHSLYAGFICDPMRYPFKVIDVIKAKLKK